MEGADALSDNELGRYLERVNEGFPELERISLDPESALTSRLDQLRDT